MQEILARLNKATFGFLSPNLAVKTWSSAALSYTLNRRLFLEVDGVYMDTWHLRYVEFSQMPHCEDKIIMDCFFFLIPNIWVPIFQRMRETKSEIRFCNKESAIFTVDATETSCEWTANRASFPDLRIGMVCKEFEDKELQRLWRKHFQG